jgi:hypothetical protein
MAPHPLDLQALRLWHLEEVFRPRPLALLMASARPRPGAPVRPAARRRRDPEDQLLALWPDIPAFPWEGASIPVPGAAAHQVFFGFLPARFLAALRQSGGVISPATFSPDPREAAPAPSPLTVPDAMADIPLGLIEVDAAGRCLKVEVSPLFCALVGASRKGRGEDMGNPLLFAAQALREAEAIREECLRDVPGATGPSLTPLHLRTILLGWSDRLQGLRAFAPFPFFRDCLVLRSGAELPVVSLFPPVFARLQRTLEDIEAGRRPSQPLEALLRADRPVPHPPQTLQAYLDPGLVGVAGISRPAFALGELTFARAVSEVRDGGLLEATLPHGANPLPVLAGLVSRVMVERAGRLCALPDPVKALTPLEPSSPSPRVPMDALIQDAMVVWVDEHMARVDVSKPDSAKPDPAKPDSAKPESAKSSQLQSFDSPDAAGLEVLPSLATLLRHFLAHPPAPDTPPTPGEWLAVCQKFQAARATVDTHLHTLSGAFGWVREFEQATRREEEIDLYYENRSEAAAALQQTHAEQFDALRAAHQDTIQAVSVLKRDLGRFADQVSQTKKQLSVPDEMPRWHRLLAGVGVQTAYYRERTEKRAARIRLLKKARADRDQCRQRLDQLSRQARKSMRDIEALRLGHTDMEEARELELATLERERDDINLRMRRLDRSRTDYPVEAESVWHTFEPQAGALSTTVLTSPLWTIPDGEALEEAREKLLAAATDVHAMVRRAWAPALTALLPQLRRLLDQPASFPPLVARKLWNTVAVWFPVARLAPEEALALLGPLPSSSLGWLWMAPDTPKPAAAALLQMAHRAVLWTDPASPAPASRLPVWLQDQGPSAEDTPDVSAPTALDWPLLTLPSPLQDWKATILGDTYGGTIRLLPDNTRLEWEGNAVVSRWVSPNASSRARHAGHGLVDELAWFRKRLRDWRRQWPVVTDGTRETPARIHVLAIAPQWVSLCRALIEEARLPVTVGEWGAPPDTDWLVVMLGGGHSLEQAEPLVFDGFIRRAGLDRVALLPRHAIELVGDAPLWQAQPALADLMELPVIDERCVISSVHRQWAGLDTGVDPGVEGETIEATPSASPADPMPEEPENAVVEVQSGESPVRTIPGETLPGETLPDDTLVDHPGFQQEDSFASLAEIAGDKPHSDARHDEGHPDAPSPEESVAGDDPWDGWPEIGEDTGEEVPSAVVPENPAPVLPVFDESEAQPEAGLEGNEHLPVLDPAANALPVDALVPDALVPEVLAPEAPVVADPLVDVPEMTGEGMVVPGFEVASPDGTSGESQNTPIDDTDEAILRALQEWEEEGPDDGDEEDDAGRAGRLEGAFLDSPGIPASGTPAPTLAEEGLAPAVKPVDKAGVTLDVTDKTPDNQDAPVRKDQPLPASMTLGGLLFPDEVNPPLPAPVRKEEDADRPPVASEAAPVAGKPKIPVPQKVPEKKDDNDIDDLFSGLEDESFWSSINQKDD